MKTLTKEELRHPDVRRVMPHLCGLGFSVDYETLAYPIVDVLRFFKESYGDAQFFPVQTVDIPGSTRLEDRFDFIEKKYAVENYIRKHGVSSRAWRPGQETTIRNLACISDLDKRVLAFMYAVVQGTDQHDDECGAIYESVYRRFAVSVAKEVSKTDCVWGYRHNTKYTELWHSGMGSRWDKETFDDCKAVRSLEDLMRVLAKVAVSAQEEGVLVRFHSVSDDLRIERCKRAAREALNEALSAFDSGNLQHAESHAHSAVHLLGQYNGQALVRKMNTQDESEKS